MLLDGLVPFLTALPQTQQHDYKICRHFNETPPFDSPLPFIAIFFLHSPYLNLLMSPKTNCWQVACDTFTCTPPGKSSSLRDILYANNESAKTKKLSRQFILYPFKIVKKNPSRNYVAIIVFLEGTTLRKNLRKHNCGFGKCMCLKYFK